MKTLLDKEKAKSCLKHFVNVGEKWIFFVNWSKRGVVQRLDSQNPAVPKKRLCSVFGDASAEPHETSSSQLAKPGTKKSTVLDLQIQININLTGWPPEEKNITQSHNSIGIW